MGIGRQSGHGSHDTSTKHNHEHSQGCHLGSAFCKKTIKTRQSMTSDGDARFGKTDERY
ncbi:hypothetical protein [Moraxella lacunata]|uniref:hypothetical protein n=1 Tax=Moraxella lacunata TaxID=477 RepID=UPI003EE3FAAC